MGHQSSVFGGSRGSCDPFQVTHFPLCST